MSIIETHFGIKIDPPFFGDDPGLIAQVRNVGDYNCNPTMDDFEAVIRQLEKDNEEQTD